MRTFRYWALHIPSGERLLRTVDKRTHGDLLELLNKWNAEQPGMWQYWEGDYTAVETDRLENPHHDR